MTVDEARAAKLCRICGEPIERRRTDAIGVYSITYDYGLEHAHTACLRQLELEREDAWKFEMEA